MATKKSADSTEKSAPKTASKSPSKTAATKTAAPSAAKTPAKKSAATGTASHPSEKQAPTHEQISALAHKYWQERGHHHGSHEADWHRAEQELKSRS